MKTYFSLRSFRLLSVLLSFSLGAASGRAQSVPPASAPPPAYQPAALDTFVVTAGADPRAAFDLAQGASVLAGDALRLRQQSTLGETLAGLPGVSSTWFGPGASRPVIRGLGGDRVRMLDNGVGSLDASNVSPDHNVAVEPLLVERIEVLRGPATLLYGSSAIGGVVNVLDNRIPSAPFAAPFVARTEARFGGAAYERTGVIVAGVGNEKFALQVTALRSASDNLSIPGFADPATPANHGHLTNSAVETKSGSVGGTYFWAGGSLGLAVSQHDSTYGLPVGEPIHIDLTQRRLDLRAELTEPFAVFAGAKVRFGLADYEHAEVDTPSGTPNTTFTNKAWEGRVEFVQLARGNWSGTIGLQAARSDFAAVGAEAVTPPFVNDTQALFALKEFKVSDALTLQLGGRYERQHVRLGAVDPLLPAYPGYAATSGETRRDDGLSLSAGAVVYPAKDWSVGFSAAWSERAPTAQERFANGPHGGTGSYEIGTVALDQEQSLGLDLTVRKRAGFVTGSVGGFVNNFKGYVFEQEDSAFYFDDASGSILPGAPVLPDDLPIFQFVATDALFYGAEAEISVHLVNTATERLHLDLSADFVHAENTSANTPLPRIPPWRVSAGLRYEHGPWTAGVGVRHAFAQNRFTASETRTDGHTLLDASVGYAFTLGRTRCEAFVRGTNLTNAEARASTSFLKDIAPLPGRGVTIGLRASF
jgi:iron complex outermembrane receptor protein